MFTKDTVDGSPVIVFHYASEDLFNVSQLWTMYRARNIVDQTKGVSQIDEVGISVDEEDAFKEFAKVATYDAYAQVVKMTKGVPGSPWIDAVVYVGDSSTSGYVTDEKSYGFMIYDNNAYNVNVVQLVDHSILQFIKDEILFNWWHMTGIDAEAGKAKDKWDEERRTLVNKHLFQLRKPLMRT